MLSVRRVLIILGLDLVFNGCLLIALVADSLSLVFDATLSRGIRTNRSLTTVSISLFELIVSSLISFNSDVRRSLLCSKIL